MVEVSDSNVTMRCKVKMYWRTGELTIISLKEISSKDHVVLATAEKKILSLSYQEQEMKAHNTFFYFYYFFSAPAGL